MVAGDGVDGMLQSSVGTNGKTFGTEKKAMESTAIAFFNMLILRFGEKMFRIIFFGRPVLTIVMPSFSIS